VSVSRHKKDPRDEPAYLILEAAHYLRLPPSTIRFWALGQNHPSGWLEPLFKPAEKNPPTLSFWNLVEIYVLATIRTKHKVSMQKVRKALRYVQGNLQKPRPLIQQEFLTDGVSLFVEKFSGLIDVGADGQMALRQVLEASLKRIDRDPEGLARRFYPWLHDPCEPRNIMIDPRRSFGRPVLRGTGISTGTLAERWRAGESIDMLTRDYPLTRDQVEAALKWESRGEKAA
jgi:uncharacterized protein (DUF433 family)